MNDCHWVWAEQLTPQRATPTDARDADAAVARRRSLRRCVVGRWKRFNWSHNVLLI